MSVPLQDHIQNRHQAVGVPEGPSPELWEGGCGSWFSCSSCSLQLLALFLLRKNPRFPVG